MLNTSLVLHLFPTHFTKAPFQNDGVGRTPETLPSQPRSAGLAGLQADVRARVTTSLHLAEVVLKAKRR